MSLDQYLPVILFILVGIGVGVVPQVLGYILGPNRPDAAKNSPYECGFEAFEDARMKFLQCHPRLHLAPLKFPQSKCMDQSLAWPEYRSFSG